MMIGVFLARGAKCARCWRVLPEVGLVPDHPDLCLRCREAVTGEACDVHALAALRFDRLFRAALARGLTHDQAIAEASDATV